MEKVLNQEQIDAMVRAAREGVTASAVPVSSAIVAWDASKAGQIGSDRVRAISLLHENFARKLTNCVGDYLRVVLEPTSVPAEHRIPGISAAVPGSKLYGFFPLDALALDCGFAT
jgi:flagellar motor switch protein FliM